MDKDTKERLKESLAYTLSLPLYRLVLFYFRMSGYLVVLTEPPSWDVPGPLNGFKNGLNNLQKKLGEAQASFLASLMGKKEELGQGTLRVKIYLTFPTWQIGENLLNQLAIFLNQTGGS